MENKYTYDDDSLEPGFKTIRRKEGKGNNTWGAVPNTVRDNDKYQEIVNRHMNDMKTDMDLTSFSDAETASIRNFLLSERNKYADAAKKIASMEDRTSEEYLSLVDTMNGVNNSFVNLSKQLQAYKKNKIEYATDQLNNSLSKGMDPEQNRQAMIMYGFYELTYLIVNTNISMIQVSIKLKRCMRLHWIWKYRTTFLAWIGL